MDSLYFVYFGIIVTILFFLFYGCTNVQQNDRIACKKSDAHQDDEIMYHPSRCWGTDPIWDCCGKVGENAPGCTVVGEDMIMFHHPRYWNTEAKHYECCGNKSKLSRGCKDGFHPRPYGKGK